MVYEDGQRNVGFLGSSDNSVGDSVEISSYIEVLGRLKF